MAYIARDWTKHNPGFPDTFAAHINELEQAVAAASTGSAGAPADGSVTDVKVAAGAAIAQSKLALSITNAEVSGSAAIAESKLTLASDAAAGTASRRTLGTGATQAAAGNDSRLSDTRTPSTGSIVDAMVNSSAAIATTKLSLGGGTANFLRADGAWATPSGTAGAIARLNSCEYWLEDFGGGPMVDGASTGTDNGVALNALVTAAKAANPNRGITVRLGRERYYFSTSPSVIDYSGFSIVGEGSLGTVTDIGKGCSQCVIANGVSFLRLQPAAHDGRGHLLQGFHVYGAGATGNGIYVKDTESLVVDEVAATDFTAGYGLRIDGGTGNAQYAQVMHGSFGSNLYGIHTTGFAPNAVLIFANRFDGKYTTSAPMAGSIAIWLETGDTHRVRDNIVQGYATGLYVQSAAAATYAKDNRFEFCNICVRVGASSVGFYLQGGDFDDNLLPGGASSTAIQIDEGAASYYIAPQYINLSKAGAVTVSHPTTRRGTYIPPVSGAPPVYTIANPTTDRALNVTADTTAQVAQVLGTLIADLQAKGVLG